MNRQIRICYILPDDWSRTDTHFYEKHELLRELESKADILILSAKHNAVFVFAAVLSARARGYRNFYVHYSFKGALSALLATWLFGGKVYYWNCGMPWLYKRSSWEERVFRYILASTIFVTGTAGLRRIYGERYGIREDAARVVPNAVRVARFQTISKEAARGKLGIPENAFVVLFVHRLSSRKGANRIPELLRQCKTFSDTLFLVVGSGPLEAALQQDVLEMGLGHAIRFEGGVPNKDIPVYFAAADVFLVPSEEEGVPHALLEAMAAGVPFVASDVGGVREITPAELHDFVLPHDDMYAFFKTMERLQADKVLAKSVSDIEKKFITRYDVSVVKNQFLELFG